MAGPALHRFELAGKRFVIDPESCFCFECDAISWDVLEYYPHTPLNRIYHLLEDRHPRKELEEVVGELEWLRATKSILAVPKFEELPKEFELEKGLQRLSVDLPDTGDAGAAAPRRGWFRPAQSASGENLSGLGGVSAAVTFLLARSAGQRELYLEIRGRKSLTAPEALAALCRDALRQGALSGKQLTIGVHLADAGIARLPKTFAGHSLGVVLELRDAGEVPDLLKRFAEANGAPLAAWAKAVAAGGRAVLCPGHADCVPAIEELEKAGFRAIEIDIAGAHLAHPDWAPQTMTDALRDAARYYAQRLLKQQYFRLDPIAPLFWRIYNGSPLRRADPAGVNELAVDAEGAIYPSRHFTGQSAFRAGSVPEGRLDEAALREFEDLGVRTTPACMRCWARHLCGGGIAAVHHALGGAVRQPSAPWCEAQREWLASAVSAFNLLSSEGINFTRVYGNLEPSPKPSLFALVRAAFQMNIGLRPIGEADAGLLTSWENWADAAYFLCNESGLFLATKYDREMDSLHPRGYEQEMLLLRKNGTPFGLLKVRPHSLPGVAQVWIYFRNPDDYAAENIRKSFRFLLGELGRQQGLRRLMAPAGPNEAGLAAFLSAIGFQEAGTLRDALYLHGAYHPVRVFTITRNPS